MGEKCETCGNDVADGLCTATCEANRLRREVAMLEGAIEGWRASLADAEARRTEAERERDEATALAGFPGWKVEYLARKEVRFAENERLLAAALQRAESAERSLAAAVEVLRPFVDALDGLVFHRAEDGTTTVTGKAVDDFDAWRGFVDALIKVRALAAALAGGSHG